MTKEGVLATLRDRLRGFPTMKAAAAELGFTPQYLSDILAGRRDPGPRVLSCLGMTKTVNYKRLKT